MKKVYVIAGHVAYHNMFSELGFENTSVLEEADLVCFTGGEDVNPALYGHPKHPTTWFSGYRDAKESMFFEKCQLMGKPMVGICRGGQFLNVMSGGTMYQDVSSHTNDHVLIDAESGESVWVTSTHHQMMCPGEGAITIAYATLCGMRTVWDEITFIEEQSDLDYEVLFYPQTKCLCFQPHPEFSGFDNMRRYFKECLNKCLGV